VPFSLDFAREILPLLLRGAVVTAEATFGGMTLAMLGGLLLALARLAGPAPSPRWRVATFPACATRRCWCSSISCSMCCRSAASASARSPPASSRLACTTAPFLAEVYRAGIEAVPGGQWEASQALGLSARDMWSDIILPQAIPPMTPVFGNFLIGMFKDTPLLATITVPELFGAAEQIAGDTYRYNEPYTMVGLIFLLISYPAAVGVRLLERRFNAN